MNSEWRKTSLGAICKFTAGSAFKPQYQGSVSGDYPFIKVSDMNIAGNELFINEAQNYVSEIQRAAMKAKLHPVGATVFAKIGVALTTNRRRLLTRPTIVDNNMMSATPKNGEVTSRFLYLLLTSLDFNTISAGTALPYLNVSDLEKIEISLPSDLAEQKVIERVAGALDDKIDLNRRINQTLEAMANAVFKSWFVDFDPVKAKIAATAEGCDPQRAAMSVISGKPDAELDTLPPEQYEQLAATAALFPDEMEESELGDIPRGWSVSKVETLLSRLSAKARYTKEQVSAYGQIPVFEQGASILLGYHNGVASYPASAESPMFIFGDHTCVTRLSCQPFDISQNVIPLQGKNRATAWVYYAVKEKQKFQEYRRHWMELISKDVVIATADICLEFSKRITKLHLQIEANERQMQSLRELRDTLLPKLLSGELSVTEAAAEVEA